MPYALCPMPYQHLMLLKKAIFQFTIDSYSLTSACRLRRSIASLVGVGQNGIIFDLIDLLIPDAPHKFDR